jgi:hypothetical protein
MSLNPEAPQRRRGRTILFSEFHTNKNSETLKRYPLYIYILMLPNNS